MYEQTVLFLYRFRYAIVVPVALAILTLTSAMVTALGSGTVLAAKAAPAQAISTSAMSDPNFVTNGFSDMVRSGERSFVIVGMGVYRGCESITNASVQGSKATAHGMAMAATGTWHGIAFTGRMIGTGIVLTLKGVVGGIIFTLKGTGSIVLFTFKGIASAGMFVLRVPAKLVGSVAHGSKANALIQPVDTKEKEAPVIDAETSAAIVSRFNADQKAKIEARLAEQIAANEDLDGAVVAGDPKRGGYPAKYDTPVAQDSLIDSWGMYNRECVSYTAWKVYQTFGNMPNWGGVGNANQWPADARAAGIATGSTPQVHAVAISMRGYYGHAMWVEQVSGNMIYVSQYNYDLHGSYSEMWVNASQFTYIYFK